MTVSWRQHVRRRLIGAVGGHTRLRVVGLLAGVLSLTSADQATVGAMATQLEAALGVDNTAIGLLATVSGAVGALTTLPFGLLADRVNRIRLLTGSILLWSAAMAASAAAQSFLMLLLSRLALGAVVAAAGPLVASLTGDFFGAAERGRIYGFILAGELVGAGFGLVVSGDLAAAASWRASFALLALAGIGLAAAVRSQLPEPSRGGQNRLPMEIAGPPQRSSATGPADALPREVHRAQVSPHEQLVLHDDPARRSLWWAARYVLSIRTNVILIVASSLGYFFFSGLRTFAVSFAKGRYGLDQAAASALVIVVGAGALIGILLTGRISDGLIARHHVAARPVVGGLSYLVAAALLLPGLLTDAALVAVPLFFLAAAGIGGANPPLDAARLDIIHSRLWGRAEAVRTVVRTALEAPAPLLFGFLSTQLGGLGSSAREQPHGAVGLDRTFLIMLAPLVLAAGLLLLGGRRTYPRDVATALASEPRREGGPARADPSTGERSGRRDEGRDGDHDGPDG